MAPYTALIVSALAATVYASPAPAITAAPVAVRQASTTTPCETIFADFFLDCATTTLAYGGAITSCPGEEPSSTWTTPTCPTPTETCTTIFIDAILDCTSTTIGYGGAVTTCPPEPASSSWTTPTCPTPTY